MYSRRHHHNRGRLRSNGYFRRLGPGIVTGIADDDPSGIGTYSQVGAATGFQLLWAAPVALPFAIAVQESTARLGLVTGRGLAALIRERFHRAVLVIAVVCVVVANTFNIGANLGSMSASVRLLVPIRFEMLIILFTAVLIVTEVLIPYQRYVQVLKWLSFSVISYLAVLFVIDANWGEVAKNTLWPQMSFSKEHVGALIAIFGTTISPYLFFWQTSEEVEERGNGDALEVGFPHKGHMQAMRGDVTMGMLSGITVMFAIMVTSGATLGAQGPVTISSAEQAAEALRPLAGDAAGLLFTLGIIGTGLLSVPVLAGSTAYALSEAFGWREGLGLKVTQAKAFYGVISFSMIAGLLMNLAGLDSVRALYWSALVNGLVAGPLILLVWILTRSQNLMGVHTSGRLSQVLVAGAAAIALTMPFLFLFSV
jgi:NRAMP (natural resistance-associated macrophage protein)-like metal ion transporter